MDTLSRCPVAAIRRLFFVSVTGFYACSACAEPLGNPPVFVANSESRVLDVLMVAKPQQILFPFGIVTTGWVYEVCPRPAASPNRCPPGTGVQPLGGVRLALNKGDTIKLRLVNQLPVVADSKHCSEPGHGDLVNNPTNLHTHGLLVEPHRAQGPGDTYGDYSFLEIRNPANAGVCPTSPAKAAAVAGLPFKICTAASRAGVPGAVHPDMDVIDNAAEYTIPVGPNHPSGFFWFHPHMHGISMNQITAGLAGLITVGKVTDMCADAACRSESVLAKENFMVLQDMQVEANGMLHTQQNPGFCNGSNESSGIFGGSAAATPPAGSCFEVGKPGRWFHTINGQLYPTITVGSHGSVWRILNASASRSYDLSLIGGDGNPIPLQILGVDGITIDTGAGTGASSPQRALDGKAQTMPCASAAGPAGVCVNHFKMMPSARLEFRVINPSPQPQQANLQTAEYFTGPAADDWPAISLASVTLAGAAADSVRVLNVGGAGAVLAEGRALGQPAKVRLPGTSKLVSPERARGSDVAMRGPVLEDTLRQAPSFAIDPQLQSGARTDPACQPLAKGHRRRIYFGYPTPTTFGLGYAEMDETGTQVPGAVKPVVPYDPTHPTVCLPLRAGNRPVTEVWELINLTAEDHNFHSHQARFRLLQTDSIYTPDAAATNVNDGFVLHDNIPLRHGSADCDGRYRAPGSTCRVSRTVVSITFGEIGDFVYHCHIMEHEDGGMMAKIRVVPAPSD